MATRLYLNRYSFFRHIQLLHLQSMAIMFSQPIEKTLPQAFRLEPLSFALAVPHRVNIPRLRLVDPCSPLYRIVQPVAAQTWRELSGIKDKRWVVPFAFDTWVVNHFSTFFAFFFPCPASPSCFQCRCSAVSAPLRPHPRSLSDKLLA